MTNPTPKPRMAVGDVTHEGICNTHEGGPCNCDWSAADQTLRGEIAYALTKKIVIDMPTARSAVDEAIRSISQPIGPDGFFDDKFDQPQGSDTALQAAAREAGWALSTLVDEIKFEKRQQVVNIINGLSAALAASEGKP